METPTPTPRHLIQKEHHLIHTPHRGTYKEKGILMLLLVTRNGGMSLSLEVTTGHGQGLYIVSTRRGTWASLSLSSIDSSHTSMISHLSSHKSNIRLPLVSLLTSVSSIASLITMA